jgi:uncharacterized membrane protein (DUF2068 family)
MTLSNPAQNKIKKHGATEANKPPAGLRLIGFFKLLKGLILLAAGIGALKLLHKDTAAEFEHWADIFRIDPDNYYIHRLLEKFSTLDDRKLKALGAGTFFYAGLLLTEGTGLLLQKRWAEYFSIIVTSSFIPLEIYEIAKRPDAERVIVLAINIAIVVYLALALRRDRKKD